jgi:hypothetical protein
MSMSDFDPDDYGLQPVQESVPRNFRRQLEADKKAAEDRAAAAEARLAEFERSNVFAQAGVPAESFFAKGYDGEMTVEAVREAYQRETGRTEDAAIQASLAGHEQAQRLAAGSTPPLANTKDAEWGALRTSVYSKKRNAQGFGADRIELERLSARDIEEVNTSIWPHPRQLAQRT